jgi:hypothetical protein
MGRAYAEVDPPGVQREEVREGERLAMLDNRELREEFFRDARAFDEKMRELDMDRRDWRELHKDNDEGWFSERLYRLHESD